VLFRQLYSTISAHYAYCGRYTNKSKTWLSRNNFTHLSDLDAFYADPTGAGLLTPKSEGFEYLLNASGACQAQQFLVVYVHSVVAHHSRRQAVRSTWGNVTRWSTPGAAVTLRFVLGRPANNTDHQQRALVDDEQAKHGDLVGSHKQHHAIAQGV